MRIIAGKYKGKKLKEFNILTTRPTVTAGVLHELMQIAEKPSGVHRETVLNVINQEFLESSGQSEVKIENKDLSDFFPVTPLSLSDSQEDVIRNIEEHDFGFKSKNARKFLEDGNKVKITVRFRGREVNNSKAGEVVLEKFIDALSDISVVEKKPKLEGRNMFIILAKKTDK